MINPLTTEEFLSSKLNNSLIPCVVVNSDGSAEEAYAFGPIKPNQVLINVSYANRRRQILTEVLVTRLWPTRRTFVDLWDNQPWEPFQTAFECRSSSVRELIDCSYAKSYTQSEVIAASGGKLQAQKPGPGVRKGELRHSFISGELEREYLMDVLPVKLDAKCKSVEKLRESWRACTGCHLGISRKERGIDHCVLGRGSLKPKLLIIGEAPGRIEEQESVVFHPGAPAGDILNAALRRTEIPLDEVYIDNACACRPPATKAGTENGKPDAEAIQACNPRLKTLVYLMKPRIVLLLGSVAYWAWFGEQPEAVGKLLGWQAGYEGPRILLNYHPAYIVRNKQNKDLRRRYLGYFKEIAEAMK